MEFDRLLRGRGVRRIYFLPLTGLGILIYKIARFSKTRLFLLAFIEATFCTRLSVFLP